MTEGNHSDPYDLLRRAQEIIERNKHNSKHAAWLADFKKLPGAQFSKKEVHVLQDPRKRARGTNEDIVVKLEESDYLQKVRQMRRHGSGAFTQLRISKKGHAALLLRSDVWMETEGHD